MAWSVLGRSGRRRAGVAVVAGAAVVGGVLAPVGTATAAADGFTQVNLVSDIPGMAQVTDPLVRNPWGVAMGPTTPLWVVNNVTGTTEVFAGANGTDPISSTRLTVKLPAEPTGIAFNPAAGTDAFSVFQGGAKRQTFFLFDTISSRVSAWGPTFDPITSSKTASFVRTHIYLGMAAAMTQFGPRLFLADAVGGIDVLGPHYRILPASRKFQDRTLPKGLSPYGVSVFGDKVYVTYAAAPGVPAKVQGAIDVFSLGGRLIHRLHTGGPLNAPWGMAIAPAHWGRFGGTLLVGNVNNGQINAFNPTTGRFLGTLRDSAGRPIANPGLWGLEFGNGVTGTPRTLIFAAGIRGYQHGLIGIIKPH
jgi:uncharacterized protein (TIGR03118 family)